MDSVQDGLTKYEKHANPKMALDYSPPGSILPIEKESRDEPNMDSNVAKSHPESDSALDGNLSKPSPTAEVYIISEEHKTTREASSSDATIPDLLGSSPGYNLSMPYHVRNLSDGMEDGKRFSPPQNFSDVSFPIYRVQSQVNCSMAKE